MYRISNSQNIFDLRRFLKMKDQGRTLTILKSNISNTVRDRDEVSIQISQKWYEIEKKSLKKLDRKSWIFFRMKKENFG